MRADLLDVRPDVAAALRDGHAVVALESTLIAHGLPRPLNLETARLAEEAVRQEGVVPATIAVLRGVPTVGLSGAELRELALADDVLKASSRDLALATSRKRTAATTVAATMRLAHRAGIRVFATGGIGGVHRGAAETWDVSADMAELARTPVAVVCAGAKGILDLPRTLEVLETLAVPVVGYGTDDFPAFHVRSSGLPLFARVDSPDEAARLLEDHWSLGGAGVMLAQPIDAAVALAPGDFEAALADANRQATARGVRGPTLTPFLLSRLAEITGGRTLRANQALVLANARLAARVARALENGPMRILAIGDIHGCSLALRALLDAVRPGPDDQIVTLGDYIDRGPDSFGVIDQLLALHRAGRLVALLGNHEDMMLCARAGRDDLRLWLACGGRETLASYSPVGDSGNLLDVPEEHWHFLEDVCVAWHETATHIFVHANVYPQVPMERQPAHMIRWEAIDESNSGPHCSGKVLICGHTQQRSGLPLNLGYAICIDTWVYGDGWLTCLDVLTGRVWQANRVGRVRTLRLDELV